MIQIGNDRELLQWFITKLREHFTITDNGEIRWFLGVVYDRDEQTEDIVATQTAYLDRSIEKYGITNETPKETPMESKFNVTMDMACETPREHSPLLEHDRNVDVYGRMDSPGYRHIRQYARPIRNQGLG